MKFKEFVSKYRKAIIIVASAAFIGAGVTTGLIITSYGNHTVAPASSGVASSTSSHISVPPIEPDASSSESAVANSSAAPAAEEVKNSSVAASSKANSAATSSKKPTTSSKTSKPKPVQTPVASSKPSSGNAWKCPNPSAHKQVQSEAVGILCSSKAEHDNLVRVYKEILKEEEEAKKNPQDPNKCWRCQKPYGDGHNGTCYSYFEPSKDQYVCHHYD